MDDTEKRWNTRAKELVGKKIVLARYMTDKEQKESYWDSKPLVLFFDDGSQMFASSDDEGNNAGAFFGSDKDGNDMSFPVI